MIQAHFPPRIVHGKESIRSLAEIGAKRVYIVADEVFHGFNSELFAALIRQFEATGAACELHFSENAEPSLEFVKRAAEGMRCFEPDLIVAIGGGSTIDAAKVMEVYYEHPDITDAALCTRFHLPRLRRKARFAAVPTTSGSGSEVTPVAVLYIPTGDPDIPRVKRGIADYQFIPDWVILDPAFTLTMPRSVTASTGLDAFVHAIEAYVSDTPKSRFADPFALEAMRLVMDRLPQALDCPGDLALRADMQLAATMGGLALANRASGASHGIGKQLATLCPLAHGFSVSILLPAVIRANAPARPAEYAEIARALGIRAGSDRDALTLLIERIDSLLHASGCPRTLADLHLDRKAFLDRVDLLADNALNDAAMRGNPRPLSHDEVRGILLSLS